MSKKVAVIMIRHPEHKNLILHGRRRDNQKWSCPGGSFEPGETPIKAAERELKEETGLKPYTLTHRKTEKITDKDTEIHLFECDCPSDLTLRVKQDLDKEFEVFKFLDPETHKDLHVKKEHNIVCSYLKERSENSKKA